MYEVVIHLIYLNDARCWCLKNGLTTPDHYRFGLDLNNLYDVRFSFVDKEWFTKFVLTWA